MKDLDGTEGYRLKVMTLDDIEAWLTENKWASRSRFDERALRHNVIIDDLLAQVQAMKEETR